MPRDTVDAVETEANVSTETGPPVFKFESHFKRDRLDARAIIWSLLNRPDEWTYWAGKQRLHHAPSNHNFRIGTRFGFWRLIRTNHCSCTTSTRKFQRGQVWELNRAYKTWKANHGNALLTARREADALAMRKAGEAARAGEMKMHQQFVDHFIRTPSQPPVNENGFLSHNNNMGAHCT
jgi:hypothetical protein